MTNKKGQKILNATIFFIVIILAYWSYQYTKKNEDELRNHGRYTVGIVSGYGKGHRSADYSIRYQYNVLGGTFRESMSVSSLNGINTNGGKYIVRFLPGNPKQSKVLLDSPVVWHSILPDSGWIIVPDYVLHYKKASAETQ